LHYLARLELSRPFTARSFPAFFFNDSQDCDLPRATFRVAPFHRSATPPASVFDPSSFTLRPLLCRLPNYPAPEPPCRDRLSICLPFLETAANPCGSRVAGNSDGRRVPELREACWPGTLILPADSELILDRANHGWHLISLPNLPNFAPNLASRNREADRPGRGIWVPHFLPIESGILPIEPEKAHFDHKRGTPSNNAKPQWS
jgi:hypothetical protein